jgi:hypothetical protein
VSQGVVDNADTANSLLSLDPDKPLPADFQQKFNVLVTLATHPKYEKFYKMLKVGISKDVVKAKMQDSGLDSSVLDKDPSSQVSLNEKPMRSLPSFHVGKSSENVFIPIENQQKFEKYLQMQQLGVSLELVKKQMEEDGLDAESISKLPILKSLAGGSGSGTGDGKESKEGKEGDEEKVPISEHPKYIKYFKMLKIGLAKEAVKAKMQMEGVDPKMLDRDPKELIPLKDPPATENPAEPDVPKVAAKDHPKYSKYFQMLKVGLPTEAVKAKMKLEGVNPDILDKDPSDLIPLDEEKKAEEDVKKVPISEHPIYSKFFKMLKVGLPAHVIKNKMQLEGVDPSMIDRDPNELIPLEDKKSDTKMVPASEHPVYSKFFKMLKVGIPPEVVKAKMALEKADPGVLDKDPSELIPLEDDQAGGSSSSAKAKAQQQAKSRKKKLYWKAIDASQVNENSLWADPSDLDLQFDEDEFNLLFVEPTKEEQPKKEVKKVVKEVKKQKVVLIDMKRAQNGGIALARIRFSFDDLKRKIVNMDDEGITTDQLKSLIEYLPNAEESGALRGYKGDLDAVGVAERYMMTMLGFDSAQKRIQCMIYKQQFRSRYLECRTKITKIQNACDDVKLSGRLKKVLKYILKVGNQLNDGEEHKGFTVDSLLKLQSAKAYDKKTTVLQYVIMLIFRHDEDCLKFPEELKHVSEAARIGFDAIITEKTGLRQEFTTNLNIVEDIRNKDPESDTNAMLDFLTKVS